MTSAAERNTIGMAASGGPVLRLEQDFTLQLDQNRQIECIVGPGLSVLFEFCFPCPSRTHRLRCLVNYDYAITLDARAFLSPSEPTHHFLRYFGYRLYRYRCLRPHAKARPVCETARL